MAEDEIRFQEETTEVVVARRRLVTISIPVPDHSKEPPSPWAGEIVDNPGIEATANLLLTHYLSTMPAGFCGKVPCNCGKVPLQVESCPHQFWPPDHCGKCHAAWGLLAWVLTTLEELRFSRARQWLRSQGVARVVDAIDALTEVWDAVDNPAGYLRWWCAQEEAPA